MSNSSECIKVMVRCRPLNKFELERGNCSVVQVNHERGEIQINKPNQADASKIFSYDAVFDENDAQQVVYEQTAFQLIEQVVEGYNGTIFAYGQTGCGKTHSMIGDITSEEHRGLIPRTFQHIMSVIENAEEKKFLVRCSYIEIYNEQIHDLLSKDVKEKKDLKESPDKGLFIKDLSMNVCKQIEDMDQYMSIGNKNRTTGATLMNLDSSRSHSIFTIYIECQQNVAKTDVITAGKLNLVDLAGSERQSKTGATGDRLKEANKINLSLSALGNVISALVDGKSSHIPYRDSKLTRLLQDSLGGNTKTIMIAAISPANYNYDETLGTLRYASRAKNIVNKPKINEDPKDALLKEYMDEINKLKQMLQNQNQNQGQDNEISLIDSTNQVSERKGGNEINQKQKEIQMEKENIAQQLQIKEQQMSFERQEKIRLEQLLIQFEKNMVKGGGQKNSQAQQKYKQIRKSLQEQKKQKEMLIIEKKRQEEELLEIKNNYNSVQEEISELRKVFQRLKKKLKTSDLEIKDIQRENEIQKQELLQTIRIQQKENSFYEQVAMKLLLESEIDIVKQSSEWDDNKQSYSIPLFIQKDKKVYYYKKGQISNFSGSQTSGFCRKREIKSKFANNNKEQLRVQLENRRGKKRQQQQMVEKNAGINDRYQIYNQNVTLNIHNNVQNNQIIQSNEKQQKSRVLQPLQGQHQTSEKQDKQNKVNFKATFQFNGNDFKNEGNEQIEEEDNQYDCDFE